MKSSFLLRLVFLLGIWSICTELQAQTYEWAKAIGGTGWDYGRSIAVDKDGNVYSFGNFSDTVDFDPSPSIYPLIVSNNNGYEDNFISKLDGHGNFLWAKSMGSGASSMSMVLDNNVNIYICGNFAGTTDMDPGVGVYNLTSVSPNNYDFYITKLDTGGNFLWAKSIGGINQEYIYRIALDQNKNVYTTGYFSGTVDFDPGVGIFNLVTGTSDAFISKLDSAGNFVWAKKLGGGGADMGRTIKIDAIGNIYIGGEFKATGDFDPGVNTFIMTSAGEKDIFITKLDPAGNFIWAKKIGGVNDEFISDLAVDDNRNVYFTGAFGGLVDFNPGIGINNLSSAGAGDIYVAKWDSMGNFAFARKLGGIGPDNPTSIALDSIANVYTTGHFYYVADFDPGVGIYNLNSSGYSDIFLSKLDHLGNFVWAKSIAGTSGDEAASITLGGKGKNIYFTGYFSDSLSFYPSNNNYFNSLGQQDILIAKYTQCNSFFNQTVSTCISSYLWNGNTYTTDGIYSYTIDFLRK